MNNKGDIRSIVSNTAQSLSIISSVIIDGSSLIQFSLIESRVAAYASIPANHISIVSLNAVSPSNSSWTIGIYVIRNGTPRLLEHAAIDLIPGNVLMAIGSTLSISPPNLPPFGMYFTT